MIKFLDLQKISQVFFFVICFLFFGYSILFGMDNIDSGFILALSNKLNQGEIIYKDFDYVRPFGTPVYWAVIMKPFWNLLPNYIFVFSRCLVVVQISIIAYNVTRIIFKSNRHRYIFHFVLFLTVLGINIFPLMPWHTIDGLFFLSFAIYYFSKKNIVLSILFAIIAATTKQPFLAPLAFIVFTGVVFRKQFNYRFSWIFFSLFLLFLGVLYVYSIPEAISYYQSSNNAGLRQLLDTGVLTYIKTLKQSFPFITLVFGVLLILKNRGVVKFSNLYVWIYSLVAMGFLLKSLYYAVRYQYYSFNIDWAFNVNVLLPIFFLYIIVKYYKDKNVFDLYFDFLVGIVIWSSSISWGANNILLALPLFFVELRNVRIIHNTYIYAMIVIGCLVYRILNPYFEESIITGKYSQVQGIPFYSGIYASERNIVYLKDSKSVYEKYKKVVFLPAFPAASVMYNEPSMRAHWEMDVEYSSQDNMKKDMETLEKQKGLYYVIDRNRNEEVSSGKGFFKSSLTKEIKNVKLKIDSVSSFYIYK